MNKKVLLILCVLLLIGNIWVWYTATLYATIPDLRVSFFDVGQGDAELIESKDGRQILIDGGPSSAILSRLGDALPFGDRYIDAIIVSHPHADHISGLLDVLERYDVGMIIESGAVYDSSEAILLEDAIRKKHIHRVVVDTRMRIIFGGGAVFSFYHPIRSFEGERPKHIHDAMVVGNLSYENRNILFMGDAEKKTEQLLQEAGAFHAVDILKVGHHGSKTSSSEAFLDTIHPAVAVISVGKNKYGHPHADVLSRFSARGVEVLRTDRDGTVEADFFSHRLRISSARGEGVVPQEIQ